MKLKSRFIIAGAAIASAAFLASCSEKLQNEAACPILCPDQGGAVQNVTLDATTLDTTVVSASGLGIETGLLIAVRGDSLDTRAILRYDTLPSRFHKVLADTTTTPVTYIDSAYLAMRIDTTALKITDLVTLEAYDVDTTLTSDSTVADTLTAPLLALFRPDRLIGSKTFTRAEIADTLKLPISNSFVLAKAQSGGRLRVGLQLKSASSAQIRVYSTESAVPTQLHFRVSPDTAVKSFLLNPYSRTPVGKALASNISDFTIIAKAPAPASPQLLSIGGLPATRVYMRFDIPAAIVDSATVVRAALILTQIPNRAIDPNDSVQIEPAVVLATTQVIDPTKAAQILAAIQLPPLKIAVGDSGVKAVELAPIFTFWRAINPATTPRAIVLRSSIEGASPLQARFFSAEAPAALRPRLQISYVRRSPLGLP